jgi:hypothetical protein
LLEADPADEEQDTIAAKSSARKNALRFEVKNLSEFQFIDTDTLEATDVEIAESMAKKVGGDW